MNHKVENINFKQIMQNKISPCIYELFDVFKLEFEKLTSGPLPNLIIILKEFEKISTRQNADDFFQNYGVGNVIKGLDRPFERQYAYEQLLLILKEFDNDKYQFIHKGTPYYFIAWVSYQYHDFSKSLFYMDAAVSEDLKDPDIKNKKMASSSIAFFLLKKVGTPNILIHNEFIDVIENTLKIYLKNSRSTININDFIEKFIKDLLYSTHRDRSLLSALYVFILEFKDVYYQLELRSNDKGSIQPFLNHLFDGARIFESLLEIKGAKGSTLRQKIESLSSKLLINNTVLISNKKLEDAFITYNELQTKGSNFQESNIASAFIIRNTTGHSLLWQDHFNSNFYITLYNNLINSIFWTIEKLWL